MQSKYGKWAIATGALLFVLFIWPTLHRYDTISRTRYEGGGQALTRTNRVTGNSQRLTDYGWIDCVPPPATQPWEPPEVKAARDNDVGFIPDPVQPKPDPFGLDHKIQPAHEPPDVLPPETFEKK